MSMSTYTIMLYGMTIIGLQCLCVGALIHIVHRLVGRVSEYADALAEARQFEPLYFTAKADNERLLDVKQRLCDRLDICRRDHSQPPIQSEEVAS